MNQFSNQLQLKVRLSNDDKLVTWTPPTISAPSWGLQRTLEGRRDYAHVFRLPNKVGWIRKWVYSRISRTQLTPQSAIDNSSTESTTVFRINASGKYIEPKMSSHWLLCPFQSCNGYTVGIAYMDVSLNHLDNMCVHPVHVGKFAMDEATGEVFVTAWPENSYMIIGWTASVSSCDRVRELFLFEAPEVDGIEPRKLLLQNSFYERRDCRICNSPTIPICHAPPSRVNSTHSSPSDYLFPLRNVYRRFRGCYFGLCVKTKYTHHSDRSSTRTVREEFIVCDIRHGIAAVSRRLRINLCQGSFSFGIGPSVTANGLLPIDTRRRITAQCIQGTESNEGSSDGAASSSNSAGATTASTVGAVKRRRNQDSVHDRDTARHQRKLRNRESARRANEARRRHLIATEQELNNLRSKVPQLLQRKQELEEEKAELSRQYSGLEAASTPGDRIDDIVGVFGYPNDDDPFFR